MMASLILLYVPHEFPIYALYLRESEKECPFPYLLLSSNCSPRKVLELDKKCRCLSRYRWTNLEFGTLQGIAREVCFGEFAIGNWAGLF